MKQAVRATRCRKAITLGFASLLAMLPLAVVAEAPGGAGPDPATPAFTMQAFMIGANPFYAGEHGAPFPVTLYMQGDSTRMDFSGPSGQRGVMLHDGAAGKGLLISLDDGIVVPMESPGLADLLVDPEDPCAFSGYRCRPVEPRTVAGKSMPGWRYRGADGRGPGGTSEGEFWIDPSRGVVVAYRGLRDGWDRPYELHAISITYGQLPAAIFDAPQVVELDAGDTPG